MEKYSELGFAKLDETRQQRTGFPEVVFCQGKSIEHLIQIYKRLYELNGSVFGTRATKEQYEALRGEFPEIQYDSLSRILRIGKLSISDEAIGSVAVCCAGTADLFVAEEAAQTVEYFGGKAERVYDVGISGLHRLLDNIEPVKNANCVIAIAGMEGALASVIGGLVENPVIAVPTSVGYGANLGGISALLTMINSCANGISVVNIDNGYGAGYIATQINRLAVGGSSNGSK